MRDDARLRVRLGGTPSGLVRLRCWDGDRLIGDRRLYDRVVELRVPARSLVLELTDVRAAHDPARMVPVRGVVAPRPGWCTEISVPLQTGATLRGRVTRPQGPARFADVEATLPDGRRMRTRCDGRGEYRLSGLPAGLVLLGAVRGDRTSVQVPLETRPGRCLPVDLVLELPVVPAPTLVPATLGGIITGRAVDADGVPLPRAGVMVRDARGTVVARGRADAGGRFAVGGNLPGASGLTVVVRSGPSRIVVDRAVVRGVGSDPERVTDLGEVRVRTSSCRPTPRTPASR